MKDPSHRGRKRQCQFLCSISRQQTSNKLPSSAHLKSVAALTPSPSSPAASDLSSGSAYAEQPTMQQVLTAHLLVSLLSSPPNFSLPLNKAKDILTAKAMSQGSSALAVGQGATRIVYNCVAKRLIKIERGRGEQTVKFNM